ncbi:37S ribosomal protein S22 [Dispira parvispora]|uniref:37S ribosomal protein S22 n=1 Tax=Dispira parvispora TaxID=1520584 RepID=A0A9W8AV05_9FUNG|nr:37S ribosomal protein S22 [Dispira parvispora]
MNFILTDVARHGPMGLRLPDLRYTHFMGGRPFSLTRLVMARGVRKRIVDNKPTLTPPVLPSIEEIQQKSQEVVEKKKRKLLQPTILREEGVLGTTDEWTQALEKFGNPADRNVDQLDALAEASMEPYLTESFPNDDASPSQRKRITTPTRFGKKYQALAILPEWLRTSITAQLDPVDKYHLRHDVLRILDSLRSTSGVPLESLLNTKRRDKAKAKARAKKSSQSDDKNQDTVVASTDTTPAILTPHILAYGTREAHAYLAVRFVTSYGVIYNVLKELRKRLPDFNPHQVLDFGTGPGTALWASHEVFGAQMQGCLGVDISEGMLERAEAILEHHQALEKVIPRVEFQRYMSYNPDQPGYDLTVSAFTLSELPTDTLRESTLESLWNQTKDVLVLIDRGTQAGSQMMLKARDWFIKQGQQVTSEDSVPSAASQTGLHIVAPCAHEGACPLKDAQAWCHFSQQVQRPAFMMQAKRCKSNQEDVKYTYLVVRRGPRPVVTPTTTTPETSQALGKRLQGESYSWSRMVFPAMKRSGHVIADMCTPEGTIARDTFVKSDGEATWKDMKKAMWGDLIPHRANHSILRRLAESTPVEPAVEIKSHRKSVKQARSSGQQRKHTKSKRATDDIEDE